PQDQGVTAGIHQNATFRPYVVQPAIPVIGFALLLDERDSILHASEDILRDTFAAPVAVKQLVAGFIHQQQVGTMPHSRSSTVFSRREKRILKPFRFIVSFDCPYCLSARSCQRRQPAFAFFRRPETAIPAIMGWMIGIPPDARRHALIAQCLQTVPWYSFVVAAELIGPHQIGSNDRTRTCCVYACVTTHLRVCLSTHAC